MASRMVEEEIMALCRGCGATFQWGYCNGKWIPLEPVESHGDLDRSYVDENGVLRADHRDRHPLGVSVNVKRLDNKVKAQDAADPVPPKKKFAFRRQPATT